MSVRCCTSMMARLLVEITPPSSISTPSVLSKLPTSRRRAFRCEGCRLIVVQRTGARKRDGRLSGRKHLEFLERPSPFENPCRGDRFGPFIDGAALDGRDAGRPGSPPRRRAPPRGPTTCTGPEHHGCLRRTLYRSRVAAPRQSNPRPSSRPAKAMQTTALLRKVSGRSLFVEGLHRFLHQVWTKRCKSFGFLVSLTAAHNSLSRGTL